MNVKIDVILLVSGVLFLVFLPSASSQQVGIEVCHHDHSANRWECGSGSGNSGDEVKYTSSGWSSWSGYSQPNSDVDGYQVRVYSSNAGNIGVQGRFFDSGGTQYTGSQRTTSSGWTPFSSITQSDSSTGGGVRVYSGGKCNIRVQFSKHDDSSGSWEDATIESTSSGWSAWSFGKQSNNDINGFRSRIYLGSCNSPPQINTDGNGDNLPSPAQVTGTSPTSDENPQLQVEVSDSDRENLNVEFYREAGNWQTVVDQDFNSGTFSNWNSDSGNLELRSSNSGNNWLVPRCDTGTMTNRMSRQLDDSGFNYNKVNYTVVVGAIDSWDDESLKLQFKTDGTWGTYHTVTPNKHGSEKYPGFDCDPDWSSPGTYTFSGTISTSKITDIRLKNSLGQNDYDESMGIKSVHIEVKRDRNLIGTDSSVDTSGDGEAVASYTWNSASCGNSYDWFVKALEDDGGASVTGNTWSFSIDCNDAPKVTDVVYSDYSSRHAFNATSYLFDPNGESDIASCGFRFRDGEGNRVEAMGSLDTSFGNGSEASCTYSSIGQLDPGFEVLESIDVRANVTDSVDTSDSLTGSHIVPNSPPYAFSPSPLNESYISEFPVDLSASVRDPEGDSFNATIYGAGNKLEEENYLSSGETVSTTWNIPDARYTDYYWKVELGDSWTVANTSFQFTKIIGQQFRNRIRTELNYSSLIMNADANKYTTFMIENRVSNTKNLTVYLSGVEAEFLNGKTVKKLPNFPGNSRKSYTIRLTPDSPTSKDLTVTVRNNNLGINTTASIPVDVNANYRQSNRSVPGIGVLQLAVLVLTATFLYSVQL